MRGFPYGNIRFNWGECYRDIDGRILGARFLVSATDEQWSYVGVRREVIFVEQSIALGTAWAQFEPNGPTLWGRLQNSVSGFLTRQFQQGAFQGITPGEGYWVKCGPATMTQADLDNGVVNIVVGFAPLRPAEFVVIAIAQMAGPPPPDIPIFLWPPSRLGARNWR